MRYKAMAKKLRQLVELDDPIPAEAVLTNEEYLQNICAEEHTNENTDTYTSENTDKCTTKCTNENTNKCTTECTNENTNEYTTECTNENTNEYTNDCINESTNEYTNDYINESTNEYTNDYINESTNEYTNDCINESTDKCTTKCTNENPNKHTNDCIVKSSNTSSNSLQNRYSNSTDNKNAITMRNKFAVVENSRGESGELPRNVVNKGEGGSDLSHKWENDGEVSEDIFGNNRLTFEDGKRVSIIKAIGIYKEISDGVTGVTQLMARIDAFLNPERIEEATTLAMWREKYKNEITVRNRFKWWS